jgi:hypothetical protein
MNNTVFYLIGATAVQRTAVAKGIASLTGARVVDTPDIYAPIFNIVPHDRIADLPDGVWAEIDVIRGAVLHTIETLSPKDWSFVFTHAGLAIPADVGVYRTVRATAETRGARFVPVTLTAGKLQKLLSFDEPSQTVDLTNQPAESAAREIVSTAGG